MKLDKVFEEINVGYNITNAVVKDKYAKIYKTLHKDSIQYTNIISSRLVEKAFSDEIKKKYFIQEKDILVFVKKPYRIAICPTSSQDIIIPNNFIILRGMNEIYYNTIFVANYLEKIGITKYVEENHITGNLTLEDIKNINLPDIDIEKQLRIAPLLKAINERSSIYSNILDNDEILIHHAINSIIGDRND